MSIVRRALAPGREALRALLQRGATADAAVAAAAPGAMRALQSLLYDDDALVRWRAVEAMGRAVASRARRDGDAAREPLRRILWLMNDESGAVVWHGPEVLGAAIAHAPGLADEFAPFVASAVDEEPWRVGARWALWRIADARPDAAARSAGALAASLGDGDARVRGHAALALRAIGAVLPLPVALDRTPFVVFDHRACALRETTVSAAASGLTGGPAARRR